MYASRGASSPFAFCLQLREHRLMATLRCIALVRAAPRTPAQLSSQARTLLRALATPPSSAPSEVRAILPSQQNYNTLTRVFAFRRPHPPAPPPAAALSPPAHPPARPPCPRPRRPRRRDQMARAGGASCRTSGAPRSARPSSAPASSTTSRRRTARPAPNSPSTKRSGI